MHSTYRQLLFRLLFLPDFRSFSLSMRYFRSSYLRMVIVQVFREETWRCLCRDASDTPCGTTRRLLPLTIDRCVADLFSHSSADLISSSFSAQRPYWLVRIVGRTTHCQAQARQIFRLRRARVWMISLFATLLVGESLLRCGVFVHLSVRDEVCIVHLTESVRSSKLTH